MDVFNIAWLPSKIPRFMGSQDLSESVGFHNHSDREMSPRPGFVGPLPN